MTWLGYEIILTSDQKIWALVVALIFALFTRFYGGRSPLVSLSIFPVVFLVACLFAINENAVFQIKADFCAKHHEVDRCAVFNSRGPA